LKEDSLSQLNLVDDKHAATLAIFPDVRTNISWRTDIIRLCFLVKSAANYLVIVLKRQVSQRTTVDALVYNAINTTFDREINACIKIANIAIDFCDATAVAQTQYIITTPSPSLSDEDDESVQDDDKAADEPVDVDKNVECALYYLRGIIGELDIDDAPGSSARSSLRKDIEKQLLRVYDKDMYPGVEYKHPDDGLPKVMDIDSSQEESQETGQKPKKRGDDDKKGTTRMEKKEANKKEIYEDLNSLAITRLKTMTLPKDEAKKEKAYSIGILQYADVEEHGYINNLGDECNKYNIAVKKVDAPKGKRTIDVSEIDAIVLVIPVGKRSISLSKPAQKKIERLRKKLEDTEILLVYKRFGKEHETKTVTYYPPWDDYVTGDEYMNVNEALEIEADDLDNLDTVSFKKWARFLYDFLRRHVKSTVLERAESKKDQSKSKATTSSPPPPLPPQEVKQKPKKETTKMEQKEANKKRTNQPVKKLTDEEAKQFKQDDSLPITRLKEMGPLNGKPLKDKDYFINIMQYGDVDEHGYIKKLEEACTKHYIIVKQVTPPIGKGRLDVSKTDAIVLVIPVSKRSEHLSKIAKKKVERLSEKASNTTILLVYKRSGTDKATKTVRYNPAGVDGTKGDHHENVKEVFEIEAESLDDLDDTSFQKWARFLDDFLHKHVKSTVVERIQAKQAAKASVLTQPPPPPQKQAQRDKKDDQVEENEEKSTPESESQSSDAASTYEPSEEEQQEDEEEEEEEEEEDEDEEQDEEEEEEDEDEEQDEEEEGAEEDDGDEEYEDDEQKEEAEDDQPTDEKRQTKPRRSPIIVDSSQEDKESQRTKPNKDDFMYMINQLLIQSDRTWLLDEFINGYIRYLCFIAVNPQGNGRWRSDNVAIVET
jgi:hypothetical protein